MVLHIIRVVFFIVIMAMSFSYAFRDVALKQGGQHVMLSILIPTLSAAGVVFADMFWRRKKINLLSGLFFGILAGLVIAYVLSLVVDLGAMLFDPPVKIEQPIHPDKPVAKNPDNPTPEEQKQAENYLEAKREYDEKKELFDRYIEHHQSIQLIKFVIGAFSVFICVTVIMQTKDEFRFIIPYVEFSKQTRGAMPLILDTSVIIDGRLPDIIKTNIIRTELIVPRFVLIELQAVADSHDRLKRNRGRRGLDVLQTLQSNDNIEINILDIHIPSVDNAPNVDTKLIALAQHLSGNIMTNDYNLNKLASVRGVDVININDLSNALKPVVLPGEQMDIKIIRPGESNEQGVGYLEDGTMVVVEEGRSHIGKTVTLQVTSALQTSAGRMIFGRFLHEVQMQVLSVQQEPEIPENPE